MAYLMHHGVKGQKWGVRRYQNEDGTLTEAGKARYGGQNNYSSKDDGMVRTLAKSSFIGRKHAADYAERAYKKQAEDSRSKAAAYKSAADSEQNPLSKHRMYEIAKKNEARANKAERRAKAQAAANANRKAYEDHTKTGKLVAQDLLLTKYGAANYRAARARGAGRIRSLFETGAGLEPIGTILAARGNRNAYGSSITLSAIND